MHVPLPPHSTLRAHPTPLIRRSEIYGSAWHSRSGRSSCEQNSRMLHFARQRRADRVDSDQEIELQTRTTAVIETAQRPATRRNLSGLGPSLGISGEWA